MAPWYEKAETKLGVTRTGDRAGKPGNNNYLVFEKGAKSLGYSEVHTGRMAINSADYDGRIASATNGARPMTLRTSSFRTARSSPPVLRKTRH